MRPFKSTQPRRSITLTPAHVQTTVEVTDATPLLTTDRAEVATTLTGAKSSNFPCSTAMSRTSY